MQQVLLQQGEHSPTEMSEVIQTPGGSQAMVVESIWDGLPVNLHAVRDNFCRQASSVPMPSPALADTVLLSRRDQCLHTILRRFAGHVGSILSMTQSPS